MYKFLRILFTVLSAIFAAAIIPVGALLSFPYALASAAMAIICFGIMLFFKSKHLETEEKDKKDVEQ